MRKKLTPLMAALCVVCCTLFNSTLFAEGSKELLPNAGDELALYCNSSLYYDFASYESYLAGNENQRLHIHIADPENEQIFLGFSQPHTQGHYPSTSLTSGYFRIRDATGAIVHGPILVDAATASIRTRAQGIAGPSQIVGAAGYDASGSDFTFNPDGLAAGDYYIEFNLQATTYDASHILFQYFDITVATEDPSPVAIDGRVYSKNWALFAPTINNNPAGTYGVYDRPVNGSFHVLSNENFVSKIDFDASNFQPAAFNIAVNSWGTKNTENHYEDRKSLESQKSIIPELKIFINDPDPSVYPSGTYGEMLVDADFPAIIGCPATGYFIRIASTSSGFTEILLDFDQATGSGIYDLGTADLLVFSTIEPGPGESAPYIRDIPWDGKNALGAVATSVPIGTEVAFSQGGYHIPVYDVEFNLDGFAASIVRPTSPYALKFYHDDVNITSGTTELETGCVPYSVPGCRTWADSTYGDINTINTYWYAKREIEISTITVAEPDCGCTPSGINISGMAYNDVNINGLKGSSENGTSLANIDATLYEDINEDGLIDGGDTAIETVQTDANGDYNFSVSLTSSPASTNKTVTVNTDDAAEFTAVAYGGFAIENDMTLSIGFDPIFGSNTEIGLKFDNINLPKATNITNAYIEFTASGSSGSATETYTIDVENNANPATFSNLAYDLTSRTKLGAPVSWTTSTWADGVVYPTADIKALVQAVVDRSDWVAGNSMAFFIDGTLETRAAHAFDGDPTKVPKLIIEYSDYGLPKKYLVSLDPNDFPSGKTLSTDNIEKTTVETLDYNDCENYFGLVPPLPVELSSLSATEQNCNVIVEWTAAIEDNLSHYEVEYSNNQNNFITKATVEAELSRSNNSYLFTDEDAGRNNYYRLKMVDLDGSVEYSKIVSAGLNCKNGNTLTVYPNPVRNNAPLQIGIQTEKREANLVITNILGKVVQVLNISTNIGKNQVTVDVSDLPNGTYFILDQNEMGQTPVKFVKDN